jgi:hypothetical protein
MNKSQIIDQVLGRIAKAKIYFEEKGKYYLNENKEKKGHTYTGFISFPSQRAETPGQIEEEIDVVAKNPNEAKEMIKAILKDEYEPNGKIEHLEERFGLFF